MQTPKRATLTSVQMLRGIAAVLVVISHTLSELGTRKGPESIVIDEKIIHQLGFGVDIFFVISGFIMVYTTNDRSGSAAAGLKFLIARFLRISPLYWAMTSLAMLIALVLPHAFNHQDMSLPRILSSLF